MIHLILDTNIYDRSPRLQSLGFQTLMKLGHRKIVQLHLPFVVREEHLAHQYKKADECFSRIISQLNKVEKLRAFSDELNEDLRDLRKSTEKIKRCTIGEIEDHFEQWIEQYIDYPMATYHGSGFISFPFAAVVNAEISYETPNEEKEIASESKEFESNMLTVEGYCFIGLSIDEFKKIDQHLHHMFEELMEIAEIAVDRIESIKLTGF